MCQVAEIVHGLVNEFHGAPNRNNGDTFMVIWRVTGLTQQRVCKYADLSVTCFAKIIGSLQQATSLSSYRGHPGLQWRTSSNYRVCLHCSLHDGWAIEGAVGSEFKIDASYISPNVSVAINVEEYTHVYGVAMMVTGSVVKLCSPSIRDKFRLVETAFVPGSKDLELSWGLPEGAMGHAEGGEVPGGVDSGRALQACQREGSVVGGSSVGLSESVSVCQRHAPGRGQSLISPLPGGRPHRKSPSEDPIELNALDLYLDDLAVETPCDLGKRTWGARLRFKARQWLHVEKERKLQMEADQLFDSDRALVDMRSKYTEQFLQVFNMGYQNYYQGEWEAAKGLLTKTRTMLGFVDGPSCEILEFMASHNYEAICVVSHLTWLVSDCSWSGGLGSAFLQGSVDTFSF